MQLLRAGRLCCPEGCCEDEPAAGGGDVQTDCEGKGHLEVRRGWELAEQVASCLSRHLTNF